MGTDDEAVRYAATNDGVYMTDEAFTFWLTAHDARVKAEARDAGFADSYGGLVVSMQDPTVRQNLRIEPRRGVHAALTICDEAAPREYWIDAAEFALFSPDSQRMILEGGVTVRESR